MKLAILHICFFSILMLHSITVFAQHNWLDSVKKAAAIQKADTNKVWTLTHISGYYSLNDPDSGLWYAKQALMLSEKLKYDRGIFWSTVAMDHSLYILGNYNGQFAKTCRRIKCAI